MKKFLVFFLAIVMLFSLTTVSMAALIDTDYTTNKVKVLGSASEFENSGTDNNVIVYGSYAISDLYSVNLSYSCESDKIDDFNSFAIGGRVQASDNLSVGLQYTMALDRDSKELLDSWSIFADYRYPINEQWAIAGQLFHGDSDLIILNVVEIQGEFKITDIFYVNAGFAYNNSKTEPSDHNEVISALVGFQVYPLKQFGIGYDYMSGEHTDGDKVDRHLVQAQYKF